jgi:hypothetical protein
MVREPSHVKQLSLNHVCKIGLIKTLIASPVHSILRQKQIQLKEKADTSEGEDP